MTEIWLSGSSTRSYITLLNRDLRYDSWIPSNLKAIIFFIIVKIFKDIIVTNRTFAKVYHIIKILKGKGKFEVKFYY